MKIKIGFFIIFLSVLMIQLVGRQDKIKGHDIIKSSASNPGGYVGYRFEHDLFSKYDIFFNWTDTPKIHPTGIYPAMLQFWFHAGSGGYIGPQIEYVSKSNVTRKVIFTIWNMDNGPYTIHPYEGNCNYAPNNAEGKNVQCALLQNAWEDGKIYKITIQQDVVLSDGVVWKATITDMQNNNEALIGKIKLDDQNISKGYGPLSEYTGGFFEYYMGNNNDCDQAEYDKFIRIGPYADGKWLAWKGTYQNPDCLRSRRYSPKIGTIIEEVGTGVNRSPVEPLQGSLWELAHDLPLSVFITSPTENANVNGPVIIRTYTASETQVQRVEFYIDDFLQGIDAEAPYALQWNSQEYPSGSHKLKAVVYDGLGRSYSYETWVNVIQNTLSINVGTGGMTEPPPGTYKYDYGSTISIKAIPWTYYDFSGWTGEIPAAQLYDNPLTITMNSDKSMTANFKRIVYPPLQLSGQRIVNRSVSQAENINMLMWNSNPNNENIIFYRIYLINGDSRSLLGEVNSSTFRYMHRKVEKTISYMYSVVAVNNEPREGDPAAVTIR